MSGYEVLMHVAESCSPFRSRFDSVSGLMNLSDLSKVHACDIWVAISVPTIAENPHNFTATTR